MICVEPMCIHEFDGTIIQMGFALVALGFVLLVRSPTSCPPISHFPAAGKPFFYNFLTSFAHLRWTGFEPWSPLIRFSAPVLRYCLCSTCLACRVCVLTFQGLGDDFSVMVVQWVL